MKVSNVTSTVPTVQLVVRDAVTELLLTNEFCANAFAGHDRMNRLVSIGQITRFIIPSMTQRWLFRHPVMLMPLGANVLPCAVTMMMHEVLHVRHRCVKSSVGKISVCSGGIGDTLSPLRRGLARLCVGHCRIRSGLRAFNLFFRGTPAKRKNSS